MSLCFLRNTFAVNSFLQNKTRILFKKQRCCRYCPIGFPSIHFSRTQWSILSKYDRAERTCALEHFEAFSKLNRTSCISRRSFCHLLWTGIVLYSFPIPRVRAVESQVYEYDTKSTRGPAEWGSLDKSYSLCSEGKLQSPIVLTKSNATVENVSQSPFQLTSRRAKFFARQEPSLQDIIVIEQNFPPPSMVGDVPLIDQSGIPAPAAIIQDTTTKDTYTFDHILFHIPSSEHALEGIRMDAEINIVFRKSSRDPNFIYLSTLLQIGDFNPLLNPIIQLYSSFLNEESSKKPKIDFDIGEIIPPLSSCSYFYYQGSLPFPPCSENVQWLILAEPITVGQEQWNMIRSCQRIDNVRPLQASNDRNIVLYSNSSLQSDETVP